MICPRCGRNFTATMVGHKLCSACRDNFDGLVERALLEMTERLASEIISPTGRSSLRPSEKAKYLVHIEVRAMLEACRRLGLWLTPMEDHEVEATRKLGHEVEATRERRCNLCGMPYQRHGDRWLPRCLHSTPPMNEYGS